MRQSSISVGVLAVGVWLGVAAGPARGAFMPFLEYKFNQGSGPAVNTGTLGAGTNGFLNAGTTYVADQPSGVGFSLDFNGTTSGVLVPDTFDYINKLTIEAWVKPDAVNGLRVLWDDYGNPGVLLAVNNGAASFALSTAAHPGLGTGVSGGTLVTGQWQHVAGVYDGAQMRLYVNGVLAGSTATSGGIIDNPGGFQAALGRDNVSQLLVYDGRLDDFRLFNDALAVNELAGGAFAPAAVPVPPTVLMALFGAVGLGLARRRR